MRKTILILLTGAVVFTGFGVQAQSVSPTGLTRERTALTNQIRTLKNALKSRTKSLQSSIETLENQVTILTPPVCSANEITKWNGSSWQCEILPNPTKSQWVKFSLSGTTVRINGKSSGISSVTRLQRGQYRVNFTSPMASSQYAVAVTSAYVQDTSVDNTTRNYTTVSVWNNDKGQRLDAAPSAHILIMGN